MSILTCPYCQKDTGGNHEWNCPMNPVNINNNEFQLNTNQITTQFTISNNSINNEMPHYYHISCLELAINNFKNKNVHVIDKNMTIGEFIEKCVPEKC